jgi:hypothetical protein
MEMIRSSETPIDFQQNPQVYIPEYRTLHVILSYVKLLCPHPPPPTTYISTFERDHDASVTRTTDLEKRIRKGYKDNE